MSRRLFHAIVIVGTAMGCSSSDSTGPSDAKPDVADGASTSDGSSSDGSVDTFPGIMPMMPDSTTDSFPMIAADTGTTDTFPGISPAMDSFPGIMPPPSPTPS
jgi:hypothetical protein